MERYLVLVSNRRSQFFYSITNGKSYCVYDIYKQMNLFERCLRKFLLVLHLSISYFYGDWRYDKTFFSKIIIEDGTLDSAIFRRLRTMHPQAQLIYWFRNSLNAIDYYKSREMHIAHAQLCDRILSFDRKDADLMGYEYVENCYSLDSTLDLSVNNKYDIIYLGSDKSRFNQIMNVVTYSNEIGLNNFIYIYSKTRRPSEIINNHFMPYRDYLLQMIQSKAILDIVDVGYQTGYSLRFLEALFYHKKLITNMEMIKDEPFYNPNNVLVVDTNDINACKAISSFLKLPYKEVDETYIKRFDFSTWLNQF